MSITYKSPEESTPMQPFTRTDGERLAAIRAEVVEMQVQIIEYRDQQTHNENPYESMWWNLYEEKRATFQIVLDLIDRECAK